MKGRYGRKRFKDMELNTENLKARYKKLRRTLTNRVKKCYTKKDIDDIYTMCQHSPHHIFNELRDTCKDDEDKLQEIDYHEHWYNNIYKPLVKKRKEEIYKRLDLAIQDIYDE